MNDSELNRLLQQSSVPARSETAWNESAAETARLARVRDREEHSRSVTPARWRTIPWALAAISAFVLAGFILGHQVAQRSQRRNDLAVARKLFSEVNALFPSQVEMVVLDGSEPRIVLTDKPMQERGAPLFLRICGPGGCHRIITFSGERVRINGLDFDVLQDAGGRIIVAGDRFVWSSDDKSKPLSLAIEAASLAAML